ncbi:MAG: hypothetical protein DHS20C13_08680 [Thermodesulfobacteriota bacterium]|nr:MAG: hypothetical protein DHS20C13_08680 [Thermodesulfobacteriota bacterium]
MNDTEKAIKILKNNWPDHCLLAGDQNVIDAAKSVEDRTPPDSIFEPVDGGDSFELGEALTIVVQGLIIIRTSLQIYKLLKETKKAQVTPNEVKLELQKELQIDELPSVIEDKIDSVLSEICL